MRIFIFAEHFMFCKARKKLLQPGVFAINRDDIGGELSDGCLGVWGPVFAFGVTSQRYQDPTNSEFHNDFKNYKKFFMDAGIWKDLTRKIFMLELEVPESEVQLYKVMRADKVEKLDQGLCTAVISKLDISWIIQIYALLPEKTFMRLRCYSGSMRCLPLCERGEDTTPVSLPKDDAMYYPGEYTLDQFVERDGTVNMFDWYLTAFPSGATSYEEIRDRLVADMESRKA